MRRWYRYALLGALLLAGAAASDSPATAQGLPRRAEAALLHHVMQHVGWPEVAFPGPEAPIVLAVVGKDPYGSLLERALDGRYAGRIVEIRRFSEPAALEACHALLVPENLGPELETVLALVQGLGVLTVGAGDGFARRGAMVEIGVRDGRLRYALNARAAEDEGVELGPELVKLAAEVVR